MTLKGTAAGLRRATASRVAEVVARQQPRPLRAFAFLRADDGRIIRCEDDASSSPAQPGCMTQRSPEEKPTP
jgi:hypothetical protein